jgi:hypothetical protein
MFGKFSCELLPDAPRGTGDHGKMGWGEQSSSWRLRGVGLSDICSGLCHTLGTVL